MTSELEFVGFVEGGKLPEEVSKRIGAAIRGLDGKRARITVGEAKRSRSNNQNAYYWGVVVAAVTRMFRDAGNYVDAEDVHEFLKLHVGKLKQVLVGPDGEVHISVGSTTKLSKMEFEAYLDAIRAWAAEMGCGIPLPNESTV